MSFLAGLNTQAHTDIAPAANSLGNGGSFTVETGLYDATIETAYAWKRPNGAIQMDFEFKLDNGQKYPTNFIITNEHGEIVTHKDDGTKSYLKGFETANSIVFMALAGKELSALQGQAKTINKRNYDTKQDEPVNVEYYPDLIGKKVTLGLLQRAMFKRAQVNGKWEETTETQVRTVVHSVFHPIKHFTFIEGRNAVVAGTPPSSDFYNQWKETWHDTKNVQDLTKGAYLNKTATASSAVAAPAATASATVVPEGGNIFG